MTKTPSGVLDLQTANDDEVNLVFTTFRCESAETDLLMHSTLVLIHILHLYVHQYKILGGVGHVTNTQKVTDPKTYVTR